MTDPVYFRTPSGRTCRIIGDVASVYVGDGAWMDDETALDIFVRGDFEPVDEPETKVRRVRTAGGARLFDQPIGSVIVTDPRDLMPDPRPRSGGPVKMDERVAREMFDGTWGGYTAKVTHVREDENGVTRVFGTITGDYEVGKFSRSFAPDGTVTHELLRLGWAHQGKGFGSGFIAHSEEAYARNGYTTVRLTAADDVGGVVWAKLGYDWQTDLGVVVGHRSLIDGLRGNGGAATGSLEAPPEDPTELLAELEGPNPPSPRELVERGGLAEWALKAYGWHGQRTLGGVKSVRAGAVVMQLVVDPQSQTEMKRTPRVRRVRTMEGARIYGQPIGSVIVPDAPNLPDLPDLDPPDTAVLEKPAAPVLPKAPKWTQKDQTAWHSGAFAPPGWQYVSAYVEHWEDDESEWSYSLVALDDQGRVVSNGGELTAHSFNAAVYEVLHDELKGSFDESVEPIKFSLSYGVDVRIDRLKNGPWDQSTNERNTVSVNTGTGKPWALALSVEPEALFVNVDHGNPDDLSEAQFFEIFDVLKAMHPDKPLKSDNQVMRERLKKWEAQPEVDLEDEDVDLEEVTPKAEVAKHVEPAYVTDGTVTTIVATDHPKWVAVRSTYDVHDNVIEVEIRGRDVKGRPVRIAEQFTPPMTKYDIEHNIDELLDTVDTVFDESLARTETVDGVEVRIDYFKNQSAGILSANGHALNFHTSETGDKASITLGTTIMDDAPDDTDATRWALIGAAEKNFDWSFDSLPEHHKQSIVGWGNATTKPKANTPKEPSVPNKLSTGDTAVAKTMIKSIADRIAEGVDPKLAHEQYKKDLHKTRLRVQRARRKKEAAEKAAKAKAAAETDVPTDVLKGVTSTSDDDVAVDKALAGLEEQDDAVFSGLNPKNTKIGKTYWYDAMPSDAEEGKYYPVDNIPMGGVTGGVNGFAVRRNGVNYLVESDNIMPDAVELERLDKNVKMVQAVLISVPENRRGVLRGVAFMQQKNNADAHWEKAYDMPGFTSYATGGRGGITVWAGNDAKPTSIAHEFGHTLDTEMSAISKPISKGGAAVGQTKTWNDAVNADAAIAGGHKMIGFTETRPGGHKITPGAPHVSEYGKASPVEDFAEGVRLWLKDRREGKIGYAKNLETEPGVYVNVRFKDLYPARAALLDQVFGVTSDTTPTAFSNFQYDRIKAELQFHPDLSTPELAEILGVPDNLDLTIAVANAKKLLEADKYEADKVKVAQNISVLSHEGFVALAIDDDPDMVVFALDGTDLTNGPELGEAVSAERATRVAIGLALFKNAYQKEMTLAAAAKPDDVENVVAEESELVSALALNNNPLAKLLSKSARDDVLKSVNETLISSFKTTDSNASDASASLDNADDLTALLAKAIKGEASIADTAGDVKFTLMKRKAAVKYKRKKQLLAKGFDADYAEAEAIADAQAYESKAVLKYAEGLGLLTPGGQYTPVAAAYTPTGGGKNKAGKWAQALAALPPGKLYPAKAFKDEHAGWPKNTAGSKLIDASGKVKYKNAKAQNGWNGQMDLPQQAKANLNRQIAERVPDTPENWEMLYKFLQARSGSSLDEYNDMSPEARMWEYEKASALIVSGWASTAGDSSPWPLAVQMAANDQFDIKSSPFLRMEKTFAGAHEKTKKETQELYKAHGAFLRTLLQAQYENTQAAFAAEGITHLRLVRGMSGHIPIPDSGEGPMPMQPLNSWTSRRAVATRFGSTYTVAVVPVERILGSAATGFGCRNEYEFVVMDTPGDVTITKNAALAEQIMK